MAEVISDDGTAIAFERLGDGPPDLPRARRPDAAGGILATARRPLLHRPEQHVGLPAGEERPFRRLLVEAHLVEAPGRVGEVQPPGRVSKKLRITERWFLIEESESPRSLMWTTYYPSTSSGSTQETGASAASSPSGREAAHRWKRSSFSRYSEIVLSERPPARLTSKKRIASPT